ncbi:MAG: hypothetical protein ABJH98_06665 [Reichenbachiella sp.]|uniref:hypothetical protein n=1 Tax=Reichenbachiella sp. TaxID=2184521 RepID=UPI003297DA98
MYDPRFLGIWVFCLPDELQFSCFLPNDTDHPNYRRVMTTFLKERILLVLLSLVAFFFAARVGLIPNAFLRHDQQANYSYLIAHELFRDQSKKAKIEQGRT